MKKKWLPALFLFFFSYKICAQPVIVAEKAESGYFSLAFGGQTASIYVDEKDHWLMHRAAALLCDDIEKVTGQRPAILSSLPASAKNLIIIGSLDSSATIRSLAAARKINAASLQGKWESFLLQTVRQPLPGIENALILTGSDKRGTAYAVFELSRQIGVSPWYWWADVPVKEKKTIYIKSGNYRYGSPAVKYRGIFINDEAPAFSGWTKEKFGGVNHLVYEKIFELLLRLKANYLWPAMWGNAFNDDDPLNPVLADQYGIVMGTSHHEPMLRAQQEWKRYGTGNWNYESNETVLKNFWTTGIRNMGSHESIVTVGMRGDGDKPMTEGTAISLLERIVKDQRSIIEQVTGKPAAATPQLWALYKEVQDYYDAGMRVPDDVTLLLCDDNWGNIRRLPKFTDRPRTGGYGIYYHFDYVGDPRNYKWLNTNQIERTWEQMHLAYEHGVDRIWIVNVGDLKPMEFPISFFLDYAWDPKKWNEKNLPDYYTRWSAQQFGNEYAKKIGHIIKSYTQYNARRKPELLSPDTYSLLNYGEADSMVHAYNSLRSEAGQIGRELPSRYVDAYYELVLHPVEACSNLNELYVTVAKNRLYASRRWGIANEMADKAKQLFLNDSLISLHYNKELAGGKWDHMMDQTHIGYTYWQQPPFNKMPWVKYVPADSMLSKQEDTVWTTRNARYMIPAKRSYPVFYEQDGILSIDAEHYSRAISTSTIVWKPVPGLGRTGSAISSFPVTAPAQKPGNTSPCLQYEIYSYDSGSFQIAAYFSPSLNFLHDEGLQYGISVDNEPPQIISINQDDNDKSVWEKWVAHNIIIKTTGHSFSAPGKHLIRYWMVSPAVILQKIVLDFGGIRESYLGPPETIVR
jgi:Glycosyl hydrolase family 115/Gylcosyl hydrolase family 115 C-terminal domain